MNTKHLLMYLLLAVGGSWLPLGTPALAAPPPSCTSSQVTENFTGNSTNCQWYYFGGACLTAGNIPSTGTSSPGGDVPAVGAAAEVTAPLAIRRSSPVILGYLRLVGGGAASAGVPSGSQLPADTSHRYMENRCLVFMGLWPIGWEGLY